MRGTDSLKGAKVLVFGLGILGGGVATTNWLLKQGARVTITDLKSKEQLKTSLARIKGKVVLHLGGHIKEDIRDHDSIVINPDVSARNEYVVYAKKLGKRIENEATLFFNYFKKPVIAVTGTRGKTTVATWAHSLLETTFPALRAGNSGTYPFLSSKISQKKYGAGVVELPSFQLELFDHVTSAPHIAIITNLFQDHLNRHRTMEEYGRTKAHIFSQQNNTDHLILNQDNEWTPFFLKQKPRAHVWYVSLKPLPKKRDGVFVQGNYVYTQEKGNAHRLFSINDFKKTWGEHNVYNLLSSSLAAHLAGISWKVITPHIKKLPSIEFRQEIIFKNKKLTIINDTTATSPEGGIAALKRFGGPNTILISGGTDRALNHTVWARELSGAITPKNLILLSGSATTNMLELLGTWGRKSTQVDTLNDAVTAAFTLAKKYRQATILFSPAAKSFEKFQNEYDRGNQFNKLITQHIRTLGGVA